MDCPLEERVLVHPFCCRNSIESVGIILKNLDPLRAKKTFIRKKLGHSMVSAIKASSVTL